MSRTAESPSAAQPMAAPATPLGLLIRAAAFAPRAPALVAGSLRLDQAGYARAVARLAAQLRALGVGGRPVGLMLGNSAQMAIGLFAVQAAGGVMLPLNPDYTPGELAPLLARARPCLIMAFAASADRLRESLAGTRGCALLILPEDAATWLAGLPDDPPPPAEPDPAGLALIQFTGGTTGTPKGAMLTHAALAANVAQREAVLPTSWADERIVCAMPLFHSFASAMCHLLAANCAGTLVLLPRYRPDRLVDAIEKERITRLPAGPTLLQSLLAWDGFEGRRLASLRSVWSGSAPLPAAIQERWEAATGIPVFEGYGQTEAGPVLTYHGPGMVLKPLSVGPALPGTDIEIRDPASGEPLPTGQTGEIVARGPQLMSGYLDDPAATAETLVGGWLRTGDVGHLDSDGWLFITDRLRDMAIVGGYNVYPREVDEVLMRCPGVSAAAAFAVPDSYRGEVLWAYVEGTAAPAALAAHAEAHLVRYKRPVAWRHLPALPRTGLGKIDRAALRALAVAELAGGAA